MDARKPYATMNSPAPAEGASSPGFPSASMYQTSTSPARVQEKNPCPDAWFGNTDERISHQKTTPLLSDNPSGSNEVPMTPLGLLLQGKDQIVEIPLKTILIKAMQTMPAKKAPFFRCLHVGMCGYQVSVDLDVSGSRVTVEPLTTIATIKGDVCSSVSDAVGSAVQKAFEYLENKHFIKLLDYSSNLVEEYDDKPASGDVNSCSYVTEKVLEVWMLAIHEIEKFSCQLGRNAASENMFGVKTPAGDRYSEAKEFVDSLLSRYIDKHRELDLQFKGYEAQRSAYLKECNDEYNAFRLKCYRQVVHFTEKDVLEFVLKYLGLKEAEYNNKPLLEAGAFRGEVQIWLPEVKEAGCGGITKFKGKNLLTSATAEEDAAGKALRYMESKLKITVVDKNYAKRVRAKENHSMLIQLLRKMLHTAEQIKKQFSTMVDYMDEGVGIFGLPAFSQQFPGQAELAAVKFCEEGIIKAHADCVRAYEEAARKITGLEKYYPGDPYFDE